PGAKAYSKSRQPPHIRIRSIAPVVRWRLMVIADREQYQENDSEADSLWRGRGQAPLVLWYRNEPAFFQVEYAADARDFGDKRAVRPAELLLNAKGFAVVSDKDA